MTNNFIHNWMKKRFSDENKVLRTLFEAGKVAGSATYKQSQTVWTVFVLQGQFVYSAYSVVKTKSLFI